MAVSAFSENGKYYSAISNDGRLKVWDTETNTLKQEYTPDLHLNSPPTCLQWIIASDTFEPQKKEGKNKKVDQENQYLALGTASGKILLYSVARAKVQNVVCDTQDKSNKCIVALDWHRNYGLYSCSKAGFVSSWNLQSGKIKSKYNVTVDGKSQKSNSVSAIKIVPHSQNTDITYLVTASWQVCVWRLSDGESTIVRQLGHNAATSVMLELVTVGSSSWLVEGLQNERLLSFWDLSTVTDEDPPELNGDVGSTPKRPRKKSHNMSPTSPMYNFVLEDAPKFINVRMNDDDGGNTLKMAAVARSGVVHFYSHVLNGVTTKPIKPTVTIQVASTDAQPQPLPLVACSLLEDDLLIAYTQGPTYMFDKITPDLSTKTMVLVRGPTSKNKKKTKQKKDKSKALIESTQDVVYSETVNINRKRVKPGAELEVPMEARLENLSLDPRSRNRAAVNQNLTKLLVQGLHSNDRRLIKTVLQKDDNLVARQTAGSLPPESVPKLLQRLADMASRRTGQCASACTWTSAVLQRHAAFILATGTRNEPLTQLLALFTQRRSHLCQLLNLKGRLELAMSQRAVKQDEISGQEPIIDYKDTSSDEEMEIEQYDSGSEQSWGDGDEDVSADENEDVLSASDLEGE